MFTSLNLENPEASLGLKKERKNKGVEGWEMKNTQDSLFPPFDGGSRRSGLTREEEKF